MILKVPFFIPIPTENQQLYWSEGVEPGTINTQYMAAMSYVIYFTQNYLFQMTNKFQTYTTNRLKDYTGERAQCFSNQDI